MYFLDLLGSINVERCIEMFVSRIVECFSRFEEDVDIKSLQKRLYRLIEELRMKTPNYLEKSVIHIERVEDDDGVYDWAYLLEENDEGQRYSFELAPWRDVLGYKVDCDELKKYEKEYYVMLVLWEITWFGYDEETIQNRVKEWDE